MRNFGTVKKLMFPLLKSILPSVSDPAVEMWGSHSLNSIQHVMEILTFFHLYRPLSRDHEKFGKNAIRIVRHL